MPASTCLTGGGGVDRFQFNLASEGADIIADFVTGTDRVWIDDAGFGLAGTGTLGGERRCLRARRRRDQRERHRSCSMPRRHQLLWDADGIGAGSAQLLATLIGVNAMSASDFLIV